MIKRIIITLCCIVSSLLILPCTTQGRAFWDMFWVSGVGVPWTSNQQEDNLLHTVRVAINWVLGMLAFAALVLCLYAGFKMMISGGDSKQYTAWFSILKNAGIWLAIIAVSWLIVSLIFYLIKWTVQTTW